MAFHLALIWVNKPVNFTENLAKVRYIGWLHFVTHVFVMGVSGQVGVMGCIIVTKNKLAGGILIVISVAQFYDFPVAENNRLVIIKQRTVKKSEFAFYETLALGLVIKSQKFNDNITARDDGIIQPL